MKTKQSANSKPAAQQAPTFTGAYVSDIVNVCIASALSGQHAVILGAPGYGKTAIARSLAKQLAPDAWTFTRLDPSTPPEVLRGAYNPADLLNGKLTRVVDGTPYAPNARVSILDEIFRANEVVFDAMLDVLDRLDAKPDQAPVVWATANFVAQGERVEALLDRIGLWCWLNPDVLDVSGIVGAHLDGIAGGLQVADAMPTWKEIEAVRAMQPGNNAKRTVTDLLQTLAQEAQAQGRRAHPRRLAQWAKIAYRSAAYYAGSADFTGIDERATRVLRYAYPAPTSEESAAWQQIAAAVVDVVGAAIEDIRIKALGKFREVAGIQDASIRTGKVGELGGMLANWQATLQQVGGDDPRVNETMQDLKKWFGAAVCGEMPNGK